jgi:hypothetical protein
MEDKLYTSKVGHGNKSRYIYRCIKTFKNGVLLLIPVFTKKTHKPVTGKRRIDLSFYARRSEIDEYELS